MLRVLRGLHKIGILARNQSTVLFSVFPSEASNNQSMMGGTKRPVGPTSSSIRQAGMASCPTRYEPDPLPRHRQTDRLVDNRSWRGSHTRCDYSRQSPPHTISQIFWHLVGVLARAFHKTGAILNRIVFFTVGTFYFGLNPVFAMEAKPHFKKHPSTPLLLRNKSGIEILLAFKGREDWPFSLHWSY